MEETILEIYEFYFRNQNYNDLDIEFHHCCFCENNSEKMKNVKHSKQDMAKYLILYLTHLKFNLCSWEKSKYFINSIKLSKFCDDNVVGKWSMEYWPEKKIYILICF